MDKNIPQHIGIILDGNRRWAKNNNLTAFQGHKQGFENVKTIAQHAFDSGIEILTVYAFSTENWKRSKEEVKYLMGLFEILLTKEVNALAKKGVKVNIFGRIEDFKSSLQNDILKAQDKTKDGQNGILNICLSYGGRDEIVRAVKKLLEQKIPSSKITEQLISDNLDSAGLPDPDLIIRTSAEQRLSGFLTWQSVYSEFYFPSKHWPEFTINDFDEALVEYSKRRRRFGAN